MLATQSGPLLVQDGKINAALNPQGTSRLIRNGVGIVSSTRVVFAISEDPITFYEFALLFRDGLKCADALYLDGNVSSLYVKSLGRDDERVPIGPIIGRSPIPAPRTDARRYAAVARRRPASAQRAGRRSRWRAGGRAAQQRAT